VQKKKKKVIVGTVVTRSPSSNIASIAMKDFKLAVSLFERTAPHSQRAKIALVWFLYIYPVRRYLTWVFFRVFLSSYEKRLLGHMSSIPLTSPSLVLLQVLLKTFLLQTILKTI